MEANDLVEKHRGDVRFFCEFVCMEWYAALGVCVCSTAELHSFQFFWRSQYETHTQTHTPRHMNWKKKDYHVMPRRHPISIALPILTCSHFSPSFLQKKKWYFIQFGITYFFFIVIKGDYFSLVPFFLSFLLIKHNATI